MEYTPEEFQYELKSFWQNNIENLTTEEICNILKNARYYSQGKAKNKEVYEIVINYLGYGVKRKTATLSLYIIQNNLYVLLRLPRLRYFNTRFIKHDS